MGGMGFVHYNNTIAEQLAAVTKVKRHTPGFVVTPVCMSPKDTISRLDDLRVRRGNTSRGAGGWEGGGRVSRG